jgi:hypothetical protein
LASRALKVTVGTSVARAVLLHERRARALRAREERAPRLGDLSAVAEILRAAVSVDALVARTGEARGRHDEDRSRERERNRDPDARRVWQHDTSESLRRHEELHDQRQLGLKTFFVPS